MYSVTPAVKAAWKALLAEALERARLDWQVVDHDPPRPMAELWRRQDLGLAVPEERDYAVFDRIIAEAAEQADVW